MSQNPPLARVKEEFGGKDKLVDKIVGLLGVGADESKDELRQRLLGAANKKLIRLHQVATAVKEHGGHDKLAAAAANGLGRAKDKDYVEKLTSFSNGRLLDVLQSAQRRAKAASAAPKAARTTARSAAAPKAAKASAKATAKGTGKKAATEKRA